MRVGVCMFRGGKSKQSQQSRWGMARGSMWRGTFNGGKRWVPLATHDTSHAEAGGHVEEHCMKVSDAQGHRHLQPSEPNRNGHGHVIGAGR